MDNPSNLQVVASVADIPQGQSLCVEVDGREILICNTADGVFAVDNLCTHAEARLCDGKLKGGKVLCPLHGAAFDVKTGEALTRPASIALETFPVTLDGYDILIAVDE